MLLFRASGLGKAEKLTLSAVGVPKFKVFWSGQGDGQAVKYIYFERVGEASATLQYEAFEAQAGLADDVFPEPIHCMNQCQKYKYASKVTP